MSRQHSNFIFNDRFTTKWEIRIWLFVWFLDSSLVPFLTGNNGSVYFKNIYHYRERFYKKSEFIEISLYWAILNLFKLILRSLFKKKFLVLYELIICLLQKIVHPIIYFRTTHWRALDWYHFAMKCVYFHANTTASKIKLILPLYLWRKHSKNSYSRCMNDNEYVPKPN